MTLHDLLLFRLSLAKDYTKPYHERVEQELKDYKVEQDTISSMADLNLGQLADRRYHFPHHLILTYHDAMLASFFDRDPELIIKNKTKLSGEKAQILERVYEYLKDVMQMDVQMWDAAWWYLLTGLGTAMPSYLQYGKEVDEIMAYTKDDPEVIVPDPLTVVFSPESKPGNIPYFFLKKTMTPEAVKRTYGSSKKITPDTSVAGGQKQDSAARTDADRVTVWCYYGTLCDEVKGDIKDYDPDQPYLITFTEKDGVLSKDAWFDGIEPMYDAQFFHAPTEFFGFGLAKLLKQLQREKVVRRGQMVRYADIAAYPKLAVETGTEVDKTALRDPREEVVIVYTGAPPSYLQAPNLSQIVMETSNLADQDAQALTGMPSISAGSQTAGVVKTATGQSIFAEASAARVKLAKRAFLRLYRNLMIAAFKMAQQNWSSQKTFAITDAQGNEVDIQIDRSALQDIDFDKDIDIDIETPSVNRDVLRAQAIELYNLTKDDPLVKRQKVFTHALETGFDIKDAENFVKEMEIAPGTILVDPQTGAQYEVQDDGSVISKQQEDELATPEDGSSMPTEQADIQA